MKKKFFLLTVLVCAFGLFASMAVSATEQDASVVFDVTTGSAVMSLDRGVYQDVSQNEWYYNYVAFVSMHEIFNGYPEGDFRPGREMTRAEVVRVLYAMEGEPEAEPTDEYSDVPQNEWYAEEVAWASSVNVVSGYPDGTFKPQLSVSRQDFIAMLYRYAQYKKFDVSGEAELIFPDTGDINDYAITPFSWAVKQGIISGDKEHDGIYLRPQNSSTRAQIAKMLSEFSVSYLKLGATTGAKIFTKEVTLTEGCSRLLQYGVSPAETGYPEMTWSSSDPNIVSVSRGVITGVACGEAVITATTFDGNKATCMVTVTSTPVDSYQDIADYLTIHYNAGQWNNDPSYFRNEADENWQYTYGITLDYASGSLAFIHNSYDADDGIEIYTQILTAKKATRYSCKIEVYDEVEGLAWYAEATLEPSVWRKDSAVSLKSFSCDEPGFAIDEIKTQVAEFLNEDIHYLVSSMDSVFAGMGLKATMKDFGFVNYN